MQVIDTEIPAVKLVLPKKHGDARGFFSETWRQDVAEAAGIAGPFVQDNHSFSAQQGVVRGLHFQMPPFAQGKLIRVTRGAILDVAVDIRRGSPTFGKHVAVELSAEKWNQLWVPAGFAHGFCTLVPDTEVIYKVTSYYAPQADRGLLWNDPALGIDWPVDKAILSAKDEKHPTLADLDSGFVHGESA